MDRLFVLHILFIKNNNVRAVTVRQKEVENGSKDQIEENGTQEGSFL